MMTMGKVFVVFLIAAALLFATSGEQTDTRATSASPLWESGLQQVDSFLRQGLSDDTHAALHDSLDQSGEIVGRLHDQFEQLMQ
jgi:hypothetical protein